MRSRQSDLQQRSLQTNEISSLASSRNTRFSRSRFHFEPRPRRLQLAPSPQAARWRDVIDERFHPQQSQITDVPQAGDFFKVSAIGTVVRSTSMERKKASDFPQDLLNLFDRYVHGEIHRREFIDGAQKFAVGGMTATALFEMLRPNYAWAIQVPESDTRIKVEPATIPSPKGNGTITGYMARPADATGKLPAVLVIHENRGLNPYIKDVARRLAVAKFMALAPDGLTSLGGYPGDDENGGKLFAQLDRARMSEDFLAAAAWLKSRPDCTGKLGAVGFCFGGGVVNL